MATNPETPPTSPASAPANDLEGRIQEVLGAGTVTAGRLRELRDMLQGIDPKKLKNREALLQKVQQRMSALKDAVGASSQTPEQKELGSELHALEDRLKILEGPGVMEKAGKKAKEGIEWGKDAAAATVSGAPGILKNYVESGLEAGKRSWFEGGMSFALPVLSILGIGLLAKKALQKPKSRLAKVLITLFGMGGLIAIANYSGRKAQAEIADRQARLPVEGRVKDVIDAIRGGQKVDINDPRLTDVDLLQLRGAPIIISGHEVRLERVFRGSCPVMRVAVDGNAFELGPIASTMVQSITHTRGMADIAVLLGMSVGHAYVTDGEFTRVLSALSGSTADTTVDIEYFADASKPAEKQKKVVNFTYVRPAAAAPSA